VGATLVVLALTGPVVVACSGAEPPASAPLATAPSPTPSPTPPRTHLSGRIGDDGPVLAVKIDNTVFSHPQAGLQSADLVYVEEVEYGLTRFMAVFSSEYPEQVGPVRSARISDLDILRQFGKPAFAYSGARAGMQPLLARARLFNVSGDVSGEGYWREPGRTAPWDFFGDPEVLLSRAPKARPAPDIGFTFDPATPQGGTPARAVWAEWPESSVAFRWSRSEGRWLLTSDGEASMADEGGQLGATTVIVQSVRSRSSRFTSSNGGVTPKIETVGQGKAWVFRDGRMWRARWSRPKADGGTTWTASGRPLPMDPGQIWIVLLDKGSSPQISR
jgi:hypothetical protein